MNFEHLDKLEYFKILEMLSTFCATTVGKSLALKLVPSNNKLEVKKNLEETNQALKLIEANGFPPIIEIADIKPYINILKSYVDLSTKALLEICNILKISDELKKYFSEFWDNDSFNILADYFSNLYSNSSIVAQIQKAIIDEETISDDASSKLASIRRHKRQVELNIKDKLNSILHSASSSKYIQESIVTIRNNRYVIPVKQEYRANIKGFVHDISASGATVFIEPISIFESNNEINNLKMEENIEIEKILHNLSTLLFPIYKELEDTVSTLGIIDFAFAKAKYSKSINAIEPIINNDKFINLIEARHPLIDSEKVVPISICIGKDYSLFIITGPNTGGKTVTLKTIGLLTAMACSGLNIPAKDNSSIYVFDKIFADIGDGQSISDSLSTFSSHIKNISDIVNESTENSLVLVDELGSGTDPLEGANLAISILEFFRKNNTLTVATTHYQELKRYALVTDNIQNASVEFDIENLLPTYRLLIGVPGKSNAFEISKKLGLKDEIIERAKSMLNKQDVDIETLLKKIYDDKIEIEKSKEEISKNLNQVTLLKNKLEKDNFNIENRRKEILDKAKSEAREILLSAKQKSTELINKMKNLENSSDALKNANNLRNDLNLLIKNTSNSVESDNSNIKPIDKNSITLNKKVYVSTLGQNGIIVSSINKSDEVQVQVGLIKMQVNIKFLEEPRNIKETSSKTVTDYSSRPSKTKFVNSEINVIGLSVDEAIPLIDKFIDDCILAKLQFARIVHGKGTGKLRSGIHSYLKSQKRIKSFRLGTFGEGEMGVTIVQLY